METGREGRPQRLRAKRPATPCRWTPHAGRKNNNAESPTEPQTQRDNTTPHPTREKATQAKTEAKKGQKLHPSENAHGQKCPTGKEGQRDCKGQARPPHDQPPHPPPAEEAKGLLTLLKFAPYFCYNLSLCNSILQNREIGLENHGGNTFCVQENVEKRGILGGMW